MVIIIFIPKKEQINNNLNKEIVSVKTKFVEPEIPVIEGDDNYIPEDFIPLDPSICEDISDPDEKDICLQTLG